MGKVRGKKSICRVHTAAHVPDSLCTCLQVDAMGQVIDELETQIAQLVGQAADPPAPGTSGGNAKH